jgi:diguanylate cyclase (GGDEF)-like protein/PAS domain S-box-containing protein
MSNPNDNPLPDEPLLEDLTPEQHAELARGLIRTIPAAVVVHGPDGALLEVSDGACELLGYDRDELFSLKPFGWVQPEHMRGAAGRLEAILHDGALEFDSGVVRKDGRTRPTRVSARRLDTPRGPAVISVITDITDRTEAQKRLVFLAYHDSLTGLSNRAAFDERLRIEMSNARRHGDLLALAYLDLDHFKPLNDRYGHETGDGVLIAVAERLVSSVREQDFVARLGGDEFVILLPRLRSVDELPVLADRILDRIREPVNSCGAECRITASIGFSVLEAGDDARSLVVKADVAMYAAKQNPEHQWLVWSESLTPPEA